MMEVKIPKRWIDVAGEFERSGFELTVIGAGRPAAGAKTETVTVTIHVPSEIGDVHFSKDAVDALARKLADLIRAAAERARESKRSEVKGTDVA